jgi:hypothetical protein
MESNTTAEGYVTYVVDCPDLTFLPVEVPWDAEFPSVTLQATAEDALTVRLVCSISRDTEETLHNATSVVRRIIGELAFNFSCSIGTLIQTGCYVPYRNSRGEMHGTVSTTVISSYRCSRSPKKNLKVSEVEEVIGAARDFSSARRASCLALYGSARAANDPVARFVLWYTALDYIVGAKSQSDVDDWILANYRDVKPSFDPSCDPKPTKQAVDRARTKYTDTRNSLAHVHPQEDGFSTALQRATKLSVQLELLVTLAISKKCPPSP